MEGTQMFAAVPHWDRTKVWDCKPGAKGLSYLVGKLPAQHEEEGGLVAARV